jgi:hypothetical protein
MNGDPLTPAKLTISRQLFENYFSLSGAGYVLANDALAAGWISTPYEIIEVVCLVDRVFASILLDRMLEELQPLGKAEEYLTCERVGDHRRSASITFESLGKERLREILPDIARRLREEVGVPRMEAASNDPGWHFFEELMTDVPPDRGPRREAEHTLSWLAGEEDRRDLAVLTIGQADFEWFFRLGGAGYAAATDALAQGVIGTPYEIVETVCAANKSFVRKLPDLFDRALREVGGDVDAFTAGYIRILLAETLAEIEAEFGISPRTTENKPNDKNALFAALVEGPAN